MVSDSPYLFFGQWRVKSLTLPSSLDGHYLNLPVMNNGGEIVGMVDVLKLTYATLEQVKSTGAGASMTSVG
jgi:hypothetical protein